MMTVQNRVSISIVAKPLTEPVPNTYMISAAMKVVSCASMIAASEVFWEAWTAAGSFFPVYSSSFRRSKVMMLASTAIPTPRTNAAMPGSVNTPPIIL